MTGTKGDLGQPTQEEIERAAEAMLGWLFHMPAIDVGTTERLAEVHPDDWLEMAEVTIRGYLGHRDTRPFTLRPDLPR